MRAEFAQARVRVDGMPILGVAIENLRQDVIMLRAAIIWRASTSPPARSKLCIPRSIA